MKLCLVLAAVCATLYGGSARPVVETKYGLVEGKTLTLKSGKRVSRWHAIPFAKPPVGELRWKPPQEPNYHDGVLKANNLGDACMQGRRGVIWLTHPGWNRYSEDCLHLNIYTPEYKEGVVYPVMVWLHGGGFVSSANIQYPGHFLAERDVVVVVPNYRVGIFGFLSTGDDTAPGNYGLHDQILALKYVQENIAKFGGNPDDVTVFGQSAGAASVGLLSLSPHARGLFHKMITESGSDQAIWAVNPPQSHPEDYTRQVAVNVNCTTDHTVDMVSCMRDVDAETLYALSGFSCTPGFFCQGFAPVSDGPDGILPEDPWTMREKGLQAKLPLMSGQCSDDGSAYTVMLIPESLQGGFNRTMFEYHLNHTLIGMFAPLFPDKQNDVLNAINWYYSPHPYLDDEDKNRQSFNELITDFGFGFSGDIQMKSQSATSDTYFYIMGYRSINASWIVPEWLGVPHNGELPYVIGWPMLQDNANVRLDSKIVVDIVPWNAEDQDWAEYFLTMWTNFAKYGNPTPEPVKSPGNHEPTKWEKFTEDEMNYLNLSDSHVGMVLNYRQRSFAMWTEYLPYVAGVDFIRPHHLPVEEYSLPGSVKVDTGVLEQRRNDFYETIVKKASLRPE